MTARDRRAVLIGVAVIAAAVFVFRVVPWTVKVVAHLREEAVEQSGTAERARDLLARAGAVHDSLAGVLAAIVGLAPDLVEGHTGADAAASLTGIVSLAANRHSLKVVRVDALPDSAQGVFDRVGVHAELEGDVRGVAEFLRSMETGQPLLTVTALSISAPDPAAHVEALHIEVDVAGYYLPRAHT